MKARTVAVVGMAAAAGAAALECTACATRQRTCVGTRCRASVSYDLGITIMFRGRYDEHRPGDRRRSSRWREGRRPRQRDRRGPRAACALTTLDDPGRRPGRCRDGRRRERASPGGGRRPALHVADAGRSPSQRTSVRRRGQLVCPVHHRPRPPRGMGRDRPRPQARVPARSSGTYAVWPTRRARSGSWATCSSRPACSYPSRGRDAPAAPHHGRPSSIRSAFVLGIGCPRRQRLRPRLLLAPGRLDRRIALAARLVYGAATRAA